MTVAISRAGGLVVVLEFEGDGEVRVDGSDDSVRQAEEAEGLVGGVVVVSRRGAAGHSWMDAEGRCEGEVGGGRNARWGVWVGGGGAGREEGDEQTEGLQVEGLFEVDEHMCC